jgi:hypothetical protein
MERGRLADTLPKTLDLLRESTPDYLIWKDGSAGKQMRQLSVAFEDNIAHAIDWNRINDLKKSYESALAYCTDSPLIIDGVPVYILGITHSSDHSAEHVAEAIAKLNPGVVCLESCVDRTQARVAVQLPIVEQYKCDWPLITSLDESGGPSLSDLAKHGLLEGPVDVAQFLVACGSVSGCPELTALYEAKKRNIKLESIDILESIKIVQNASIDACGYTSRRQGDLSEGVLRQVIDEEGILYEYLRIMYGEGMGGVSVQPSLLYRLIESRKRSGPFADLLLRDLHRVYRPKQFWSRIFLRDLYMSLRIRRIVAANRKSVLVITGAAHVEGIRNMLATPPDLATHVSLALSALIDDAESLGQAWRDVLRLDMFSYALPRQIDNAESAATLIATAILTNRRISLWVNNSEWQVVDANGGSDLSRFSVGAGIGNVDLIQGLLDGLVDPYTVGRLENEAASTASIDG